MKKNNSIRIISFYLFVILELVICKIPFAQNWNELSAPTNYKFNGAIKSIVTDTKGNVYAGGYFTNDSGNFYVAKWDGQSWSELGGKNALKANGCILSIAIDALGNVFAAGNFLNASRQNFVARWNGAQWTELGGNNSLFSDWNIRSICTDKSGNLYAGGGFTNGGGKQYIAKWIKSTNKWFGVRKSNGVGIPAFDPIYSLTALSNGNIYVGGQFTDASGKMFVSEWNNTDSTWGTLGVSNGINANAWIEHIISDSLNNIYVAGKFTNGIDSLKGYNYVAKWDGISWKELKGINQLNANGSINALCFDNTKQILYAAGEFSDADKNTDGKKYVAKWDGQSWSALNTESNSLNANSTIESICVNNQGDVFAAGWFKNANNDYYVAKYTYQTLPLDIINFKVTTQNNYEYVLSWQTIDESSLNRLFIEKSYNGRNFFLLNEPKLKLNKINDYTFIDSKTPRDSTIIYYRLAFQNEIGQIKYSKTLSIGNYLNPLTIKVLGNPIVNNKLQINLYSTIKRSLVCSIIDINGKCIFQELLNLTKGNNTVNLSPKFNASGVYYLSIPEASQNVLLNVIK